MLKCVSRYQSVARVDGSNIKLAYNPGDLIDNPTVEDHLLRDSPKSFKEVDETAYPKTKASQPPVKPKVPPKVPPKVEPMTVKTHAALVKDKM